MGTNIVASALILLALLLLGLVVARLFGRSASRKDLANDEPWPDAARHEPEAR